MAKPKPPPLSIRLSDADLARVDAWAGAAGLKRHAALVALVRLGLGGEVQAVETAVKPPRPFVSRLKGEWKPR